MSTFSSYEVRSEQSGRLLFASNSATALADCVAAAPAIAAANRADKITIIPAGYSVTSSRPLTGPEPRGPAAGELPIVQAYT